MTPLASVVTGYVMWLGISQACPALNVRDGTQHSTAYRTCAVTWNEPVAPTVRQTAPPSVKAKTITKAKKAKHKKHRTKPRKKRKNRK